MVSQALGWNVVPPTVLRDGPLGEGMVQLWMDGDETVDLTRLIRDDLPPLRRMVLFDAIVNNADRKGGHLIPMVGGHVYGVDHGVSLPPAGQAAHGAVVLGRRPAARTTRSTRCRSSGRGWRVELDGALSALLTRREVAAVRRRVDRLLTERLLPGAVRRLARHPLAAVLSTPDRTPERRRPAVAAARREAVGRRRSSRADLLATLAYRVPTGRRVLVGVDGRAAPARRSSPTSSPPC